MPQTKSFLAELRLAGVQLVVSAALGDEAVMVAPLDDLSLLQNHNGFGIADGGKTVGDDENRAALHEAVHALFDELLRPGVDGGGSLVQYQHRRVGHRRPGDGQQLPLSLAKVAAIVGNPGVVTLGQMADKGVGIGQLGGAWTSSSVASSLP